MKIIGPILLIVGTSIGGGILALPISAANIGFLPSVGLLIASWLIMTICAFLILEVNLWLPENTNLISMAYLTLGKAGSYLTWISYFFLFYALLAAYIASGMDVVHSLSAFLQISVSDLIAAVIFICTLGIAVYCGIRTVDLLNRFLMFLKLGFYFLLTLGLFKAVQWKNLWHPVPMHSVVSTATIMVTSFGFASIIPSLRSYFKENIKQLRFAVLIGSLIPLICYILWNTVVMGILPIQGESSLAKIGVSNHAVQELVYALSKANSWVSFLTHCFTSICVFTSFLSVALSMSDFLSDGLKIPKQGWGKPVVYLATFLPPLAISVFFPKVFIQSLSYAGILCIILLVLLPIAMVWSGRYIKGYASTYTLPIGKASLVLIASIAILTIIGGFL